MNAKQNLKWEVTENNGGGITLVVWNDGYGNEYIHSGYEYVDNHLTEDIWALYDEYNDCSQWEGNDLDDCDETTTIADLYDDHESTHVIAIGNSETYKVYLSCLGRNGAKVFGFNK
jgi:hypothetical protein